VKSIRGVTACVHTQAIERECSRRLERSSCIRERERACGRGGRVRECTRRGRARSSGRQSRCVVCRRIQGVWALALYKTRAVILDVALMSVLEGGFAPTTNLFDSWGSC